MTKTWVAGDDIGSADAERWELAVSSTVRDKHAPALGVYFAEVNGADPTGAVSAVAEINQTIADNGSVYLAGTYLIDGPLLLQASDDKVTFAPGSKLLVASGYAGDVFQIGGSAASMRHVSIQGPGSIIEQGKSGGAATALGGWTAFHFVASDGVGVTGVRIDGPIVYWCDTVIKYEAQGAGWVNSCYIDKIAPMYYRVFASCTTPTGDGYVGNRITNILGQSSNFTVFGFQNLCGRDWDFDSVSTFDFPVAAVGLQVNAAAAGPVRIKGGFIGYNISDPNGIVQAEDRYNTPPWNTPALVVRDDMIEQSRATLPTKAITSDNLFPYWSFPDAINGTQFLWRLPVGFTQVDVQARLLDVSGLAGNVAFQVTFTSPPPGASVSTAVVAVPNPAAGSSALVDLGTRSVLVGGTTYCVRVTRSGTDAGDTLAAAVGLIGVQLRPLK